MNLFGRVGAPRAVKINEQNVSGYGLKAHLVYVLWLVLLDFDGLWLLLVDFACFAFTNDLHPAKNIPTKVLLLVCLLWLGIAWIWLILLEYDWFGLDLIGLLCGFDYFW
jgi:hypothetical protein